MAFLQLRLRSLHRIRRPELSHAFRLMCGLLGFMLPLILGEFYLRYFPPKDIHPYLGEAAPGNGPYQPDPILGIDYAHPDHFYRQYAERLDQLKKASRPDKPQWLLFGSSFMQMDGMLGDHLRDALPGKQMIYLKRNEIVNVRVAQMRLMQKMYPDVERIIFTLMPLDSTQLGIYPVARTTANSRGVLVYRVPELAEQSRLLLTAWLRLLRPIPPVTQYANKLYHSVNPSFVHEHESLLREIKKVSAGKPVTILLIPTFEQITRKVGFAYQDCLVELAGKQNMEVFDARDLYKDEKDKAGLFLPDKHLSERGNRILLHALLEHLGEKTP